MYKRQIEEVNKDLKKTGKAIIALGCSFVEGQGAFNDELYEQYKFKAKDLGMPLEIQADKQEQKELLKKYPLLQMGHDRIDFTFMEYKNAFVNVLCKKYFEGNYTPINFGLRGCGNRATIKELYFYPEINWDLAKEIIVIYCPSGIERFDFINDTYNDHFRWKAMWPSWEGQHDPERQNLWRGYSKTIWSEKFGCLEQISNIQELLLWCKSKNAELIITPGFDRRYNKPHFETALQTEIKRDISGNMVDPDFKLFKPNIDSWMNMWPWDKMFRPDGHETFIDLCMDQEPTLTSNDYFFQFIDKGSPDMWVTPCSHPSAKAHDLFASLLYNHINE